MRIGITREASLLSPLVQKGVESGYEVISLPVTRITHIPFTYPSRLLSEEFSWIVFTSANGVNAFFQRLDEIKIDLPKSAKFAVISPKTSQVLQTKGIKADFISPEPYGNVLFQALVDEHLKPGNILIYPRAKEIMTDPEQLFTQANIQYFPIICYKTTHVEIDKSLSEIFSENDIILFTAPSTVISYHKQFGNPVAQPVAIGQTTANIMNKLGWSNTQILPKPDVTQILEYVR